MTAPAEESRSGEKHFGGLAQVVRWLTEERPITGPDDVGFVAGAPRRTSRWTYGERPSRPTRTDVEADVLREVRIGPAPRCAVAGETIALSVSLVNTRGEMYLGWPIELEWSSSDPSVAKVNEYGVVDVRARGRVELTCTCEGISGSVLLTVVEPAVAAAVGLPVPARLLPPRPATQPRKRIAEPPPLHRRSIERGAVRHGPLASLPFSRGTRRVLFRIAVAASTGAIVAVVLNRTPEEYFASVRAVDPRPVRPTNGLKEPARRSSGGRVASRTPLVAASGTISPGVPALPDARPAAALTDAAARVVSEAAGSAVVQPAAQPATSTAQASPPATPSPTVARVVVAPSPSQLAQGESVRLSAAGVDDRGGAVAGRTVTWKSENEDVAVVDSDGVVTARRPGTVTMVATLGDRTGRVTLTVGPARAAETTPAPARTADAAPIVRAPDPPAPRQNSAAAAGQVMRARVSEFVQALQERNSPRLAALYNAESPQDRRNLQALVERLRRPEARLKASEPQLGAPEIRDMEAAVDFDVSMSWTTPFGRVRTQASTFRAVFEPGEDGWRLVGIRAVGKVD